MYHMTEDREIEASTEARDLANEERAAEYISEQSFSDAVNEYRDKAKSDIFETAYGGEHPMSFGEKLACRLELDEKKLRCSLARPEFLSEDEFLVLCDALMLPFDIHYKEYTYVGSGGNSDGYGYPEEADKFDEEERWESCEETDIRTALVDAAFNYCTTAAAKARQLGATFEQRQLMRCLEWIEVNCHTGYENENGGMTSELAKSVCLRLISCTRSLWAHFETLNRIAKWDAAAKGIPKLTEGQKRADEILIDSFLGRPASQEEIDELMPHTDPPSPADASADQTNDNAENSLYNVQIVPTAYASQFIKVDNKNHTLTIDTAKDGIKVFHVPEEYGNAWMILKWVLESTDEKDGWFKFTEKQRNYSNTWRPQFDHSSKPNYEMKELLRYFHSGKGRGKRGLACIRIERHPRPIVKRKKRKTAKISDVAGNT